MSSPEIDEEISVIETTNDGPLTVLSLAPDDLTILQVDSADIKPDVIISLEGTPGPPGKPGDQAPTLYPVTNVSSWSVEHDYGYYPDVRIIDENGWLVEVAVEYEDISRVSISFPFPFTGTIILS